MAAPTAPAAPLKLDAKDLPVEIANAQSKSVAANASAASAIVRKFSEASGLKVDAADVPKFTMGKDVKMKRYHVGCVKDAPFNQMMILNREFPYMTGTTMPNPNAPDSSRMIEQLGCIMELADDEVDAIKKASTRRGWRYHGKPPAHEDVVASSRWQCLRLGEPGVYFRPGDKLDAHFCYIVPLEEGQTIYPGVVDNQGKDIPTPAPLLTE